MGNLAFVFSGQGDQFPGMGKTLADTYASARAVYDSCDAIRPETSRQCFSGTAEELRQTDVTQPCLFATELAAASVLTAQGVRPDAVAGFSLGEVAAAAFAGLFDVETGFRLVCRRGQLMQQESEKIEDSMAAVLRLTEDQVRELCAKYNGIYPVNFNCPGQITVSGLAEEMPAFLADVKAAGGRAVPLKVSGAFHSPLMERAAEGFAGELEGVAFAQPSTVLYSDLTAQPYSGDAKALLARQICSPVRWEMLIRSMIASGIDTFVEIGPGKTLTNLIRKTDASVRALTVEEYLEEINAQE